MVKNRKIYIIQQIILGYLCLTLTVFSSVKSPVLCFESDGHVNIETNCDSDCEVPKDNEHQDDCVEPILSQSGEVPLTLPEVKRPPEVVDCRTRLKVISTLDAKVGWIPLKVRSAPIRASLKSQQ